MSHSLTDDQREWRWWVKATTPARRWINAPVGYVFAEEYAHKPPLQTIARGKLLVIDEDRTRRRLRVMRNRPHAAAYRAPKRIRGLLSPSMRVLKERGTEALPWIEAFDKAFPAHLNPFMKAPE